MRAIAMLAAGLVSGCNWLGVHRPPPRDAACPVADAGLDAGPLACDGPTPIDPSAVVDPASFRAQASAAVCDWSLRCGWGVFGDSFCHPAFAALDAAQVEAREPFVLASARTCVSQLAAASDCYVASEIAVDCYFLNAGLPLAAPGATAVGDGCSTACAFGLACFAGRCFVGAAPGAPCSASIPCQPGLTCRAGRCDLAGLSEDCFATECAPELECRGAPGSGISFWPLPEQPPFRCVRPPCDRAPARALPHHIGCACTTDAECPAEVAGCIAGVCTLRPAAGDACGLGRLTCLGSTCTDHVCH